MNNTATADRTWGQWFKQKFSLDENYDRFSKTGHTRTTLLRDSIYHTPETLKEGDAFEKTATDLVEGTKSTGWSTIFRILPSPIRKTLGNTMRTFSNIPGIKGAQGWFKGGLFFMEGLQDLYGAAKDGITGYNQTDGGVVHKTMGGLWNGLISFTRSAINSVVGFVISAAVPALLRTRGLLGGAIGMATFFVTGPMVTSLMNKVLPIQTKSANAADTQAEGAAPAGSPLDPSSFNPNDLSSFSRASQGLAQQIIKSTEPGTMRSLYGSVSNPFLSAHFQGEH